MPLRARGGTPDIKTTLLSLNAAPRRRLGQNFMTDESLLSFIVDSLKISPGETVLEIGPGLGFLTKFLLENGAKVLAVERDSIFSRHLEKTFGQKESFRVVKQDILKFNFEHIPPSQLPIKVVGNIPYNITSPILEWLIANRAHVSEAVLTTQWEVASRLAGKPGGKNWGSLSAFLQFYAEVSLLKKAGRGSFYPTPKVDSAVIQIQFLKAPRFAVKDEEFLFGLIRRAFQKRRKTLLNALGEVAVRSGAPRHVQKHVLAMALDQCGIQPTRRPETITLAEWAKLAGVL